MKPHLAFTVENKLSDDPEAGKLGVDLHFESLDDFAPEHVARQVKPLSELLDLRTKLADLRGSLQGNDKLDEILQATLERRGQTQEAARRDRVRGRRAMPEAQTAAPAPAATVTEARPARPDRRDGTIRKATRRRRSAART